MSEVKAEIRAPTMSVSIQAPGINVGTGSPVVKEYVNAPGYTGTYTVTPNRNTQRLSTAGKRLTEDVVVNPIPSNYGLITWNGSALTVS